HCLARRRSRQPSGIGPGIGYLQKVVVSFLLDFEHFLNLRLGLQNEVLWTAAPQNKHRRLSTAALCGKHDRRGLINIGGDVEPQLVADERERRYIHAYR